MSVRAILIEPPAKDWASLARAWVSARDTARADRFRQELGLPVGTTLVMTGHQPEFWHCGILAKYIACEAASEQLGATPAWVWVDEDEVNPWSVAAPVMENGRLTRREFVLGDAPPPGVAIASAPTIHPTPTPGRAPAPVASIVEALARRSDARNGARQAAQAITDLLEPIVRPAPAIFATDLSRATLMLSLVERMASDPAPCVRAYNDAVAATPKAGLAPLRMEPGRIELPLWRLRPGAARERVYSDTVRSIPTEELAPRAIFLTLLLRLAGCDLFLHGVGGGRYDGATEAWARSWLGEALAPMAIVSATVTLDAPAGLPTEEAIARAVWRAHRARHDPSLLGHAADAAHKRALVQAIARARTDGQSASRPYREMHAALEAYRAANAEALRSLAMEADALAARREERALADSREWPFACIDMPTLRALRGRIRAEFGLSG